MPLLGLLHHVLQVDNARLELREGGDVLNEVVALLGLISAAVRAGISAWLMWSTVTLTPTCFPLLHEWVKPLDRMRARSGSTSGSSGRRRVCASAPVNVVDGVGTPDATCGWTVSSPDVHPASAAPAIGPSDLQEPAARYSIRVHNRTTPLSRPIKTDHGLRIGFSLRPALEV